MLGGKVWRSLSLVSRCSRPPLVVHSPIYSFRRTSIQSFGIPTRSFASKKTILDDFKVEKLKEWLVGREAVHGSLIPPLDERKVIAKEIDVPPATVLRWVKSVRKEIIETDNQQREEEKQKFETKTPPVAIPEPPVVTSYQSSLDQLDKKMTELLRSLNGRQRGLPLRAMIFIDGTWLMYRMKDLASSFGEVVRGINSLPLKISKALESQIPSGRPVEVVRSLIFSSSSPSDSFRHNLFSKLRDKNWEVHLFESYGTTHEKKVDISLAVEMLHYATEPQAFDIAIIVAGDADFIPALQKGKQVCIVGSRGATARDLKDPASGVKDFSVIFIEDLLSAKNNPLTTKATEITVEFIKQMGGSASLRQVGKYIQVTSPESFAFIKTSIGVLKWAASNSKVFHIVPGDTPTNPNLELQPNGGKHLPNPDGSVGPRTVAQVYQEEEDSSSPDDLLSGDQHTDDHVDDHMDDDHVDDDHVDNDADDQLTNDQLTNDRIEDDELPDDQLADDPMDDLNESEDSDWKK